MSDVCELDSGTTAANLSRRIQNTHMESSFGWELIEYEFINISSASIGSLVDFISCLTGFGSSFIVQSCMIGVLEWKLNIFIPLHVCSAGLLVGY